MTIGKIIGNSLREFRKSKGYSLNEFSCKTGYKAKTIVSIESGILLPPLKLHRIISEVFGVEFLHILNRIDFLVITEIEKQELVEYIEKLKSKQIKAWEKSNNKLEKEISRVVRNLTKMPLCINRILTNDEINEITQYTDKLIRQKIEELKNNQEVGCDE